MLGKDLLGLNGLFGMFKFASGKVCAYPAVNGKPTSQSLKIR